MLYESRKNSPRKIGPRETQKRKIVGSASRIVVCVWNVGMWSIYENPKLNNKPKTRKQTQNTETKNRGVSVEHRDVCVWNVRMLSIYENPKLDNKHKTRKQKNRGVSVEHRGACVECSDVINLWKPKTRQQIFLDSSSVLQFGPYVGS